MTAVPTEYTFLESIDPSTRLIVLPVPCSRITVTNIATQLSNPLNYNINGTIGTLNPKQSFAYEGPAVTSFTLSTTKKFTTAQIIAQEAALLVPVAYHEILVNGSFDKGSVGWTLIEGVWVNGKIQHTASGGFKAAGFQIAVVKPDTTYTLYHEGTGETAVYDGSASQALLGYGSGTRTFNTGPYSTIRVYMGSGNVGAGSLWYDNISLRKYV